MGKGAAGVHFADQKTSPTLGATNVLETLDPQRFAATGSSPVGARGGTKAGAVETAIAGAAYPRSIAFEASKQCMLEATFERGVYRIGPGDEDPVKKSGRRMLWVDARKSGMAARVFS